MIRVCAESSKLREIQTCRSNDLVIGWFLTSMSSVDDEEWPKKRFKLPNGTILEATLARTHYAPGDTVVGTLRFGKQPYPTSLQVFVAGMCRLDQRWHKTSDIDKERQADMSFLPLDTVPFWKTDVIDCMQLSEREDGAYQPPSPIVLPGMEELIERVRNETKHPELPPHKAFTFRFQLPSDGPPTLAARSCRYYYVMTMIVFLGDDKEEICLMPIPVRRIDRSERRRTFKDVGFEVIAHSNGFPTTLTVSEWNQLDEQWAPSRPVRFPNEQCLPIHDPNTNEFLSLLTIPTGRNLHPGTAIILQFSEITTEAMVRLVQVSACVKGVETVKPSNAIARSHIWDAESCCVDGLSLCTIHLQLPDTIPYTASTEFVELTATVVADLTTFFVETETFGNVHLEIPCQVIHPVEYDSDAEEDAEDEGIAELKESLGIETSDIEKELKILTLSMGEACGIRPKPGDFHK